MLAFFKAHNYSPFVTLETWTMINTPHNGVSDCWATRSGSQTHFVLQKILGFELQIIGLI
jgi:hypothetical protein